jgi:tRNA threonylcarbamoyl adenosine modification protein (Sua5/YciO/YrdC/YwlC family)
MTQLFKIHPENPQPRLIRQAVAYVSDGGTIAYPTDSGYALGCKIGNKHALERISQIRALDASHNFTLICRDLSDLGTYAKFTTPVFRLLKANTPGAYTFILRATKDVPKLVMHAKKKTIGLRIPDHKITQALLDELNQPMLSSSLIMPGDEYPLINADEIMLRLKNQVDLIIDGGYCGTGPTTVIELLDDVPVIAREGVGDLSPFL